MPNSLRELKVSKESLEKLADKAMFHGKRTLNDIIEIDYNKALEILNKAY